MLCMQERYKEAISIMNEASKYHPNNFDIYYNMGMIYTMLNDFSSAKACYEKAAVINTLEHNTDYNIAMIELILGELEESEKYFTRCIDDEKLSPLAYYQLAKIYMIRGNKEIASQALNAPLIIVVVPFGMKYGFVVFPTGYPIKVSPALLNNTPSTDLYFVFPSST